MIKNGSQDGAIHLASRFYLLHHQAIWIHQEIQKPHGEDAVLVSPWLDVIFYDDNLLERIVDS